MTVWVPTPAQVRVLDWIAAGRRLSWQGMHVSTRHAMHRRLWIIQLGDEVKLTARGERAWLRSQR